EDQALLSYAWARMQDAEEEFMHVGKAFLSLLATIEGNYLSSIQAKLLPHTWDVEDPWSRLPTGNPVTGTSLTEKMLKSLQCVEVISADSLVEPIKLRMARVLLYHQYEHELMLLKHDSSLRIHLSSGKGLASVAKSVILERIYGLQYKSLTAQARRKRENSLKWHTRIGKRWSYVTSYLGVGIVLTCSHLLETHV
ncbi:hypothetical protein EJ07DRAFT_135433, partial [Lizonia empirigonia]